MKITLEDRSPSTAPDGHQIAEMLGLGSMNIAKFSVAHIVAPAGSHGATRENQFDEIILVIAGLGVARQDYVTHDLAPKDVLLLPTGTRYAIDPTGDEALEFWAVCVPAFRPEWSNANAAKRDWRDYQTPRGAERLRPGMGDDQTS